MKGINLCRNFWFDVGFPAIRKDLPESISFLAVGPPAGSQCYGNDDEVSQDHGWGPGFVVWLTGDAYARFAQTLQLLLDGLLHEYLGYAWQVQPEHTCRVHELHRYTNYLVGYPASPEATLDWLHIPELGLFEITHRPVFYDTPGQMTKHFASFQRYPAEVWKKRLSAWLALALGSGIYAACRRTADQCSCQCR
jgi:hypothetical protein